METFIKPAFKTINLKVLLQLGMMNLICLIISDIKDYFEYIIKKHETITANLFVQTYINKIENRIVFKIKIGYKLESLSPKTMKLLESTKKKKKC